MLMFWLGLICGYLIGIASVMFISGWLLGDISIKRRDDDLFDR